MASNNTIFSDFRTDFSAHPVTGDIVLVSNEQAVATEMRNLVLTATGERWNQSIGGNIRRYLFDLPSPITSDGLRNDLKLLIDNFCERATGVDVQVYFQPDQNSYSATITYACLNSSGRSSLSVLLKRIR